MITSDYLPRSSDSYPTTLLDADTTIGFEPACTEGVCRWQNFEPTAPTLEAISESDGCNNTDFYVSKSSTLIEPFQNTELGIQQDVAKFCKFGNADVLHLTDENFHLYLHKAIILHYPTFIKHCLKFYELCANKNNIWNSKHSLCSTCANTLLDKTYIYRSVNKHLGKNTKDSPVHIIMFLKSTIAVNENEAYNVALMDGRDPGHLVRLKVKKISKFGDGFAACSAQFNKCPFILFSGGTSKTSDYVWQYDVILNKWVHCANMAHSRSKHGMAFTQGSVYVFGGKGCDNIERINISTNTRQAVALLPVGVHSFAFVVYEDKIFIFGGRTSRQKVSHVQCFDTKTNCATRLPDLPMSCSGGQAHVVKDKIYFATNHGHIIKVDPVSGKSEKCADQPYRRKHFVIFERNEQLYIFGGIKTDEPFEKDSSIYKYCPLSDSWICERSHETLLPVTASCNVLYPRHCPVKPFVKQLY